MNEMSDTVQSQTHSSTTTATSTTQTQSLTTQYRTDHGKHTVSVTFNIGLSSDSTITSLRATMNQGDHESSEYIARFNNAAKSKLVGKKISSVSLSSVGGASDTTEAFLNIAANL